MGIISVKTRAIYSVTLMIRKNYYGIQPLTIFIFEMQAFTFYTFISIIKKLQIIHLLSKLNYIKAMDQVKINYFKK